MTSTYLVVVINLATTHRHGLFDDLEGDKHPTFRRGMTLYLNQYKRSDYTCNVFNEARMVNKKLLWWLHTYATNIGCNVVEPAWQPSRQPVKNTHSLLMHSVLMHSVLMHSVLMHHFSKSMIEAICKKRNPILCNQDLHLSSIPLEASTRGVFTCVEWQLTVWSHTATDIPYSKMKFH